MHFQKAMAALLTVLFCNTVNSENQTSHSQGPVVIQ